MKRFSLIFLFLLCVFVTSAIAGPTKVLTVAEAKASAIDTNVVLTGEVVKVINDKSFLFSDGTGELLVHVNDGEMNKVAAMKAEVDVTGLIVQDFMYTEVQATSVTARN
ncbi:NirD/YgiW/YdeI family stress tolerance protein [Pseudodesulfovibrio sp. JC047]|uniref:NirD/YgiW/YdeI family stress tolerance protein n=1 Tax=Pseudodesulfovibrio sp. JC047 TaxID=2683199 RepID=UPI0013D82E27|nr:NirD/YgiW/YdeI family stress tolerance protein [Pseudodesulfovibrio sp. JC047]NDV18600.1 NirD/YgiW/YdeI family stress tolerance protein [Pseudodesulfovibrio sp. JC047]